MVDKRVHVSEWKQHEAPFKMVDQLSNITNGTANVSKYYQTKLFFWKPRTFWRPVAFQQVYNGKGIIRIVNNSEICKVIVETKLASSCFCLPIFYILLLAWPSQDVFLLPHIPWIGQGGSILLVHYSMIILKHDRQLINRFLMHMMTLSINTNKISRSIDLRYATVQKIKFLYQCSKIFEQSPYNKYCFEARKFSSLSRISVPYCFISIFLRSKWNGSMDGRNFAGA